MKERTCTLCGWRTDILIHGKGWCDRDPALKKPEWVRRAEERRLPARVRYGA